MGPVKIKLAIPCNDDQLVVKQANYQLFSNENRFYSPEGYWGQGRLGFGCRSSWCYSFVLGGTQSCFQKIVAQNEKKNMVKFEGDVKILTTVRFSNSFDVADFLDRYQSSVLKLMQKQLFQTKLTQPDQPFESNFIHQFRGRPELHEYCVSPQKFFDLTSTQKIKQHHLPLQQRTTGPASGEWRTCDRNTARPPAT